MKMSILGACVPNHKLLIPSRTLSPVFHYFLLLLPASDTTTTASATSKCGVGDSVRRVGRR